MRNICIPNQQTGIFRNISVLRLQVRNKDFLKKDERLGYCVLDIESDLEPNKTYDTWLPLLEV